MSLPLLALAGVAEALCPHCTEDPTSYEWDSPLHYGGCHKLLSRTRDLVNLAATCKDLHYIVLPIFYHLAQCYPHRRIHLLRTLARRPDLALHVKVLRLDFPPIAGGSSTTRTTRPLFWNSQRAMDGHLRPPPTISRSMPSISKRPRT